MFWYPKDLTFICPTEIYEFNNKFEGMNAVLYGASTDTEFFHLAWRNNDNTGRNVDEVVRSLRATQVDEKTPSGWIPGDQTL